MESHSVSCHPTEMTFLPLSQPVKAVTRFINLRGIQGWVVLVGWLHIKVFSAAGFCLWCCLGMKKVIQLVIKTTG